MTFSQKNIVPTLAMVEMTHLQPAKIFWVKDVNGIA